MPLLGSQSGRPTPALQEAPTPKPALAGTITILVVLALRVLVAYDPTPGWGGDPLEMEAPIVSLTPMGSLILDALTFAGAALILASMARRGMAPPLWQTLCLAAGAVAIALHARVLRTASMENLTLGSGWLAAFTAAFAATQAARDPRLRALIAAALLGLIAPLTIKGLVEYFIEQPESVKMFLENKARILSANGWTEDSPMARAYWERLRQREATAWFGLANVFATLAAASFTALAGLTLAALRDRTTPARSQTLAFLLIGAALAATGVYLAGAKGGYAAAALGLALVLLTSTWPRLAPALGAPKGPRLVEGDRKNSAGPDGAGATSDRARTNLGPILALSLPVLALVAIAARGLMGERLHELSLLFRWFYIQTAAKIFAAHPLLGTGPDGFKEAYMLLKPAISPEDVSSPHSIFFDLTARLGLGGLALAALLIAWLWHAGGALLPTRAELPSLATPQEPTRTDARLLLITIAIATAAAALIEQQGATVTSTLARAGGLAGFLLIAIATLRLFRTAARLTIPALAAAALAALTHCQIELTGVTPGANLWVFLLIAAGVPSAAPQPRAVPDPTPPRPRALAAPLIPTILLALLIPFALVPTARWELKLRAAYRQVEDLPSLTARADAIAHDRPLPRDSARALATDLSIATATAVSSDKRSLLLAVNQLRFDRTVAAYERLYGAVIQGEPSDSPTAKQWPKPCPHYIPPDYETAQALSRLAIALAASHLARGEDGPAYSLTNVAFSVASALAQDHPAPRTCAWLGNLSRGLAEMEPRLRDFYLQQAVEALEKAAALAPHEVLYQLQLARTHSTLGHRAEAAKWAVLARQTNQDLRLDPLRQLSQRELDELAAIEKGAPNAAPRPPGAP
jgi:O-Antigen ligase